MPHQIGDVCGKSLADSQPTKAVKRLYGWNQINGVRNKCSYPWTNTGAKNAKPPGPKEAKVPEPKATGVQEPKAVALEVACKRSKQTPLGLLQNDPKNTGTFTTTTRIDEISDTKKWHQRSVFCHRKCLVTQIGAITNSMSLKIKLCTYRRKWHQWQQFVSPNRNFPWQRFVTKCKRRHQCGV